MRVFVVTPPDPIVSLEEAKRHLRVDGDDEDDLIASFIDAATGHIDGPEGWLGRALGPQILEARFGACCGGTVRLPYPPFIELVSVSYLDGTNIEQMADLADVEVLGSDVVPMTSWPWAGGSPRREAVRLRYRAGYDVLPAPIRSAILLMVGDLYRNRETVAATVMTTVPMSTTVENLLAPFRVYA